MALSIIAAMPAGRDRDSRELAVLEAMAAPLNARYGYSSLEVQRALERSIALAESLGRTDSRVAGLAALGAAFFVQGRTADSHRTTSRALDLADPESELAGQAHVIAGFSAFSLGMPADGLGHLERAAKLASGAVWLSLGTRPDVHGKAFSAHALWLLGRDEEALTACREAITLARAIDHPYSQVLARAYACITHQMRRDLPELKNAVDELRRLCDRYGFAYYREWALIADGWCREDASGIDLVRQGIGNLRSQRAFARMPYWRFAREHGIEIAVRGGGHNAAGLGVWDGALVIDLSSMRSTNVSPQDHTVRVDAGATWGDVDHATVAFGMAVPSGFIASTGVAGLTLGGGTGYLTRRFGLTIDSLLSADVVLADGSLVTASESSNSDLFWALRGGGGNFGVVTSFTFRCHDIGEAGTIIGGPVLYDFADTAEVMRWYRELLPSLPEELNGWIALLTIPPAPPFPEALWGRKACGIVWCYTGPHDRADEVLEPVRSYGSPLLVGLQPMPFTALQGAFDPLYPAGLQWYWRADFFNEISDAAIDVHLKYGAQLPTGHSTMHLYPMDGAASRVPADATAFAYRDGGYNGIIVGVDPDPANADLISRWAKDYWEELHPTSAGGAYVNFLMEEGQDRVRASYRGNWDRLVQVKNRYDPDNVFHINQNIHPSNEPTP
jgi:FAD/FMN-containing dehydrogenase/tetratricopeptide (TPR) repeat protein